ncbi:MAG: hypothetical protein QM680_10015 [Luteolibacter sp.]
MTERTNLIDTFFPIWQLDQNGNPELLGSAFMLKACNIFFIITATHVMEKALRSPLFVPTNKELYHLTGKCSGYPSSSLDVCLIEPDDYSLLKLLDRYKPIDIDSVDMNDMTLDNDSYSISGFPSVLSSINLMECSVDAQFLIHVTTPQSLRMYRKCQVDRKSHLVLRHSKKRAKTVHGMMMRPPELYGMSGGPIFKHTYCQERNIFENRLVGIIIEKNLLLDV